MLDHRVEIAIDRVLNLLNTLHSRNRPPIDLRFAGPALA